MNNCGINSKKTVKAITIPLMGKEIYLFYHRLNLTPVDKKISDLQGKFCYAAKNQLIETPKANKSLTYRISED